MEAVFSLLENGVGMSFKYLCRDLFATVGRETMQDLSLG